MRLRRLLVIPVMALAMAVAGPAWAASYTVTVGGSSAPGSHAATAQSVGAVRWGYQNPGTSTLQLTCSSMRLDLSVGSGSSTGSLAAVPSGSSSGCTWPGGSMLYAHVGTWQLDLTGPATSGSTDVIDGVLRNVRIDNSYAVCRFKTVGEARVRFHEATQRLEIVETGLSGLLRQTDVLGCWGQLRNNGAVNWEASFAVTSPDGAIYVG